MYLPLCASSFFSLISMSPVLPRRLVTAETLASLSLSPSPSETHSIRNQQVNTAATREEKKSTHSTLFAHPHAKTNRVPRTKRTCQGPVPRRTRDTEATDVFIRLRPGCCKLTTRRERLRLGAATAAGSKQTNKRHTHTHRKERKGTRCADGGATGSPRGKRI